MFTLIENGEIYAPEPRGRGSVLLACERIVKIGEVDRKAAEALDPELTVVNAEGCIVAPGIIDPHEHLLGGSGESGFATQTPEIFPHEIVTAGITTVVGVLGVDTTMKTMAGLLAKAKGLKEEGISAFIYSGGYNVPPTTIMGTIRNDIMFIDEVIGAGEIAIADERCTDANPQELARLISDAHIGGMLSNKAGITHIHAGDKDARLKLLHEVIENFNVQPEWIYPTHVGRNEKLFEAGMEFSKLGATIDIDVTVPGDLPKWLRFYLERGGDPEKLTASSDSSITAPANLCEQMRQAVTDHGFRLEQVLPLLTKNVASVLKLPRKGRLAEECDADILLLRRDSLEIVDVIARGRHMVRDGKLVLQEKFLEKSNRNVTLRGAESEE